MDIEKIVIVGDGRFAEAVGNAVAEGNSGTDVRMLTHKQEYEEQVKSTGHFRHFSDVNLPSNLSITHDPEKAIQGANILFSILPAQVTSEVIAQLKPIILDNWDNIQAIISGTKGIVVDSRQRISEVFADIFGEEKILGCEGKFGVLSGPNFAADLMDLDPMMSTIASHNLQVIEYLQEIIPKKIMRLYPSKDVVGVEIIGALKNIIAIAAGMAHGLGFKDSTTATVIGRGAEEIKKMARKFGAQRRTFHSECPAMSDLEMTARSSQSRNFQFGVHAAQRLPYPEKKLGIAEGTQTLKAVLPVIGEQELDMPISLAVQKVLEGVNPSEVIRELMERALQTTY
ncbi:hypothetical protein K9L63_00580 [Candidatus Gracilibacteria bacterium]|nr:hypothetical protein [Candidatus Gracilibacteria bacterium]